MLLFSSNLRKRLPVLILLLLTAFPLSLVAYHASARAQWQQKVDQWVLDNANSGEEVSYLVVLRQQADLSGVEKLAAKGEKGTAVYGLLTEVAQRTQPSLIAGLKASGAAFHPFWIKNMIWVRSESDLVESLARRSDVARIAANPWTRLDALQDPLLGRSTAGDLAPEWNIELVGAPDVWSAGVTGTGVIIGGQDTGYDWQHPALMTQYRGWDGQTANHNYSWHDAIHEDNPNTPPGNSCGFDSVEPCDDGSHGTHTMGTMVGHDGPENQIGMAPGAQWIGCRNMEDGWGTPATYAECYEWFVAPYPLNGDPFTNGDPLKAPDVINNSWSCPAQEGCTEPDILRGVVENVRAAGILTVHSAANSGPACGSLSVPPAIYDASFTVGATDNVDQIAGFSSRGPSQQDNELLIKPDISAPGVGIRSSIPGGGYGIKSGTSMAGPHVAGLVALLIEVEPALAGDVDQLEEIIRDTAVIRYSSEGCGADTPQSVPNNAFGWGRIDAFSAYKEAAAQPTPEPTPAPDSTSTPQPTATVVPPNRTLFVPTWFAP